MELAMILKKIGYGGATQRGNGGVQIRSYHGGGRQLTVELRAGVDIRRVRFQDHAAGLAGHRDHGVVDLLQVEVRHRVLHCAQVESPNGR